MNALLKLEPYNYFGSDEEEAVAEAVRAGTLSGFVAGPPDERGKEINGGGWVRSLEALWAEKYLVRHAISFNSATSAIQAACVAANVRAGDIVLTTPWTMSATYAAPRALGACVDFVDIEPDYYSIDPDRLAEELERSAQVGASIQAVIAVNLFGHPAYVEHMNAIVGDYPGCVLIEDSAQTPWAEEYGEKAGTIGDIGVYSLNSHKHIQCGEGGIAVTDDDDFAARMRSFRNHGCEPLGLNLRMTELQAAVAYYQLRDIERHVAARRGIGDFLTRELGDLMEPPKVRNGCGHDYYLWTAKTDRDLGDIPHIKGYIQPLNRVFHSETSCPVTERMREQVICIETCKWTPDSYTRLVEAIRRELH